MSHPHSDDAQFPCDCPWCDPDVDSDDGRPIDTVAVRDAYL